VRPEQDWCSLCYAAVKPAFDPLTAPLADVMGRGGDPDIVAEPAEPFEPEARSGPEAVHHPEVVPAVVAPDESTAGDERMADVSDVDVMLSMLAAEHRRSEPASELAERLGDRSTRVAVMVGGTFVVGAVLFAILTALGALL